MPDFSVPPLPRLQSESAADTGGWPLVFEQPGVMSPGRYLRVRLFIGAALGALAGSLFAFLILRLPPDLATLGCLAGGAGCGAILGWIIRPPRRAWRRLIASPQELRLVRADGYEQALPPEAVELVVGERSVDLSGGEMLVWRRLRLVVAGTTMKLQFTPVDCPTVYATLMAVCPNAIGINPAAVVRLPPALPGWTAEQWLVLVHSVVGRELRRMVRRTAITALLVLVGAVAGLLFLPTVLFSSSGGSPGRGVFKLIVAEIVAWILGVTLASLALRQHLAGRRTVRELLRAQQDPALATRFAADATIVTAGSTAPMAKKA